MSRPAMAKLFPDDLTGAIYGLLLLTFTYYWVVSHFTISAFGIALLSAGFLIFTLAFFHYAEILQLTRLYKSDSERQISYRQLRTELMMADGFTPLYSRVIAKTLLLLEKFHRDFIPYDENNVPQRYDIPQRQIWGMKRPAILWTRQSFDRCLLMAMCIPIAIYFVSLLGGDGEYIHIVSGQWVAP